MAKRKLIIPLTLAVISASLMLIYALNFSNQPHAVAETPLDAPPEKPEGPLFVIPENPLGTLGLFSSLAIAFGIFALMRKK